MQKIPFQVARKALEKHLRDEFSSSIMVPVISDHSKIEGTSLRVAINEFAYKDSGAQHLPVPIGVKGHIRFFMNEYVDNNEGNELLFEYLDIFVGYFSRDYVLRLEDGAKVSLYINKMEEGEYVHYGNGKIGYSKKFHFVITYPGAIADY